MSTPPFLLVRLHQFYINEFRLFRYFTRQKPIQALIMEEIYYRKDTRSSRSVSIEHLDISLLTKFKKLFQSIYNIAGSTMELNRPTL